MITLMSTEIYVILTLIITYKYFVNKAVYAPGVFGGEVYNFLLTNYF